MNGFLKIILHNHIIKVIMQHFMLLIEFEN